jgi:hypothetical protein
MSKYKQVKVVFTDRDILAESLREWAKEQKKEVEVHAEAQSLYGYTGDVRPEKAHLIIRRKYVQASANDMGFEVMRDGSIQVHISDYDTSRGGQILERLETLYAKNMALSEARARGLQVMDVVEENGEFHISLAGTYDGD